MQSSLTGLEIQIYSSFYPCELHIVMARWDWNSRPLTGVQLLNKHGPWCR